MHGRIIEVVCYDETRLGYQAKGELGIPGRRYFPRQAYERDTPTRRFGRCRSHRPNPDRRPFGIHALRSIGAFNGGSPFLGCGGLGSIWGHRDRRIK